MKLSEQFKLHPEYEGCSTLYAKDTEIGELFSFVPDKYDSSHDVLVGTTIINNETYRVIIHEDQIDISNKKSVAISKVGKSIFAVISRVIYDKHKIIASRKQVQETYINYIEDHWKVNDVVDGRITEISQSHGVFVDVGYGVPSLIFKANICDARLTAEDLCMKVNDPIGLVYEGTNNHKVFVSHKELLGTWQYLVDKLNIKKGDSIIGKVTSVQEYGIFVALHPNLSGLAPVTSDIQEGDYVRVTVDRVVPQVQKIVLSITDVVDESEVPDDRFKPTEYVFAQTI